MSIIQELKHKKEDFRVEIRKSKQGKTLNANRQKLIEKLFEEDVLKENKKSVISDQNTYDNQQNHNINQSQKCLILNINSQEKQQQLIQSGNNSFASILKIEQIYTLQEIAELLGQFQVYLTKSSQIIIQNPSNSNQQSTQTYLNNELQQLQIVQKLLRDIHFDLLKYEDLFKQINDKNCHLFENEKIHIKLFEYLLTILLHQQNALQIDIQGAEALLSKIFQYLVNIGLNSDKALEDYFNFHIIDYFINVMISQNFYIQKSKMILFSVNLLDHIAQKNKQQHIKLLVQKEISRQILTLMEDVKKSILKQQDISYNPNKDNYIGIQEQLDFTNLSNDNFEPFYQRLLVHLSSILSNISHHKELIEQTDKSNLINICQQLIIVVCNDLNDRQKQTRDLKKFYSSLSSQQKSKEVIDEEEYDEDESATNDTCSKRKQSSFNLSQSIFKSSEEQHIYEELVQTENYLGQSLQNIIGIMNAAELNTFVGENTAFFVFVENQILSVDQQTSENSNRLQVYGDLIHSLLMGDGNQIELIFEKIQILDQVNNMLYSSFDNIVMIGLSCLYNILISESSYQFDKIYSHDKNIVSHLLDLINTKQINNQLQSQSLKTLSTFVDKASKSVLDITLRQTNIMNIVIQKMDPTNDPTIIKASLLLLESLLKSEEGYSQNNQQFLQEYNDNYLKQTIQNELNIYQKCLIKTFNQNIPDNYWALKFYANPTGYHQINKLFNSTHSKEIILKLDQILNDYLE